MWRDLVRPSGDLGKQIGGFDIGRLSKLKARMRRSDIIFAVFAVLMILLAIASFLL